MAFLTKKEQTMINLINLNTALTLSQRNELIAQVKTNARLRSDGYRKKVKIFLNVISGIRNNNIAAGLIK